MPFDVRRWCSRLDVPLVHGEPPFVFPHALGPWTTPSPDLRQRNRAGRMFCAGARSLVQSVDKALGGFYRRLAALKALARKLAELYYRVLRYGLTYAEQGLRVYEQKYAESQRRLLAKLATKQGFKLVSVQLQPNPPTARM